MPTSSYEVMGGQDGEFKKSDVVVSHKLANRVVLHILLCHLRINCLELDMSHPGFPLPSPVIFYHTLSFILMPALSYGVMDCQAEDGSSKCSSAVSI